MIFVDVSVPALGKTYDFRLDETSRVAAVLEEMAEIICRSEQCELAGDARDLILCRAEDHRIFAADLTLLECGVRTGNRLMLL